VRIRLGLIVLLPIFWGCAPSAEADGDGKSCQVIHDCGPGESCVEGICKKTSNDAPDPIDAGSSAIPDAALAPATDGGSAQPGDAGLPPNPDGGQPTNTDAGPGGAGDAGPPGADGGGALMDGSPGTGPDAGLLISDGGAQTADSAFPLLDAGGPDAGFLPPDAGPLPVDAGPTLPDAGPLPPDAGPPPPDAGPPPPDAGPPDAGPPPDGGPEVWELFDYTATDFLLGDTSQGAEVDGTGNVVALGNGTNSGFFTSRRLDIGAPGELEQLYWVPSAPYGKPIPDDPGSDLEATLYTEDGLDLTDMVFLLHAEGQGALAADDTITDSAGGHPVKLVVADAGGSAHVGGKVGNGIYVPRNDYFVIDDADTDADFAYTGEVFTWAGWVKFESCDASVTDDNLILLGGEDPHIWIGARCPEETAHFQVMDDAKKGKGTSTAIDIVDGQWHHLAGVKEQNPEQATLYVDGQPIETITDNWGTFSNFTDKIFIGEFPIGTGPDFNYSSTLTFDEVVMFKRPLTSDEVGALFRRGALRLRLQVRACPAAGCGGVDFQGPDGTDATFFQENTIPFIAPTQNTFFIFPTPLAGQLFEYRAYFDTDDAAFRPKLEAVRLEGEIP
jgi:hypothetical protein